MTVSFKPPTVRFNPYRLIYYPKNHGQSFSSKMSIIDHYMFICYWLDMEIYVDLRVLVRSNIARRHKNAGIIGF